MRTLAVAIIVSVICAIRASAMDFRLAGSTIYATGIIEAGDAAKLSRLARGNDLASGFDDYVVRLNSPGGLTLEGMAIGEVIRVARLETLVARGDICASACALAFLGGTRRYATGNGVGRRLEFGATLGFHGFRAATDSVQVENETLVVSRVLTALILEYAMQMRSVDLGWLATTLSVAPGKLFIVHRPVDIAALSIFLEGIPDTVPKDWYLNACRLVVNGETPALETSGGRVLSNNEVIPTIKALRTIIVAGRYETGHIADMLATLPDSDAIDLALGGPFFLDMRKPILEARTISLERGAGFYYDDCIAVRTKHDLSVILVDRVSHVLLRKDFSEDGHVDFRLAMYDENAVLW
jgi:hypothetical protein